MPKMKTIKDYWNYDNRGNMLPAGTIVNVESLCQNGQYSAQSVTYQTHTFPVFKDSLEPVPAPVFKFKAGDRVKKVTGDYAFEGVVVSAYVKRDGVTDRYDVENDDGCVHIFNASQLAHKETE